MASKFRKLEWEQKANEIEQRLPDPDLGRDRDGREIVRLLTTFGFFFNELENRREFDAKVAAARSGVREPSPAQSASVRIGGLRLTAKSPGSGGNSLVATITPGAAATFALQSVDQAASQAQLQMALDALDGAIPFLSNDPEIAALQQQAADFLKSLPDSVTDENGDVTHPRDEARDIITKTWDDSRVARTTLDPAHLRDDFIASLEANGIVGDDADAALAAYDDAQSKLAEAVAGIFSLSLSDGSKTETFAEVPTGFPYPFLQATYERDVDFFEHVPRDETEVAIFDTEEERVAALQALADQRAALEASVFGGTSDFITAPSWTSLDTPVPGVYQFSGGVDAVPGASTPALKDESEYVYSVAGREKYSLPELREIVSSAIARADAWLAV